MYVVSRVSRWGTRGDAELTIGGDDGSATREALDAVHKHDPARAYSLMDEAARDRKVDEEVGIVDVFDANAQVTYAGRRVVCRNGLGANGYDVCYASVCECPGRNGSVDPAKDGDNRRSIREAVMRSSAGGTLTCPNRACHR